jgi:TP901 family phage tail tape measure protein
MAVSAMKVPTIFTAVDRFSHVVSKMSGGVTKFSNTTASAVQRMDHKINGVFNSLNGMSQLAVGGGLSMLFYQGGKDIMDYETAIASLGAVTGTTVGSMNKQIEGLARESGRSAIDIAKSFENIGSKMSEYLKNPQALSNISRASILLAEASRMDVEEATEGLTSLMNQFGLKHDKALHLVNKLSAGEDVGAATISQTIDMTRQFAASIRMAGGTAEEAIALVQATSKTMGNMGVGRGFRNIAIDMITGKGMDKNKQRALKMVGADIDIVSAKSTHFYDRLMEIKKLLGNNQAMGMFFKKTGMEAGGTFLREFETYEKYLKYIRENDTATIKAAKNTDTFSYAIARLKDSFTNYMVTGGEVNTSLSVAKDLILLLTRNMGGLINTVGAVIGVFLAWKTFVGVITLVTSVIGALTVATKAYHLTALAAAISGQSFVGVLLSGTAPLAAWAGPIALLVGGLGLLGYALYESSDAVVYASSRSAEALEAKNQAWIKSTTVQRQELEKQKQMLDNSIPDLRGLKGAAFDVEAEKMFNIERKKDLLGKNYNLGIIERTNQKYLSNVNVQNNNIPFKSDYGVTPTSPITNYDRAKRMSRDELLKPENLAGTNKSSFEDMLSAYKGKQEVIITVKDPGNAVEKVEQAGLNGIPAQTSSTKIPKPR